MTATWMVLLYGDKSWATAPKEVQLKVKESHGAYAKACAERGYKITGAEELGLSSSAITARRPAGGALAVSNGPFAETIEYLGGYYRVETDDPQGLAQLTGELLLTHGGGAELRPVIQHP
jgi:hypothetical protein